MGGGTGGYGNGAGGGMGGGYAAQSAGMALQTVNQIAGKSALGGTAKHATAKHHKAANAKAHKAAAAANGNERAMVKPAGQSWTAHTAGAGTASASGSGAALSTSKNTGALNANQLALLLQAPVQVSNLSIGVLGIA
jgi:hypothetical protein